MGEPKGLNLIPWTSVLSLTCPPSDTDEKASKKSSAAIVGRLASGRLHDIKLTICSQRRLCGLARPFVGVITIISRVAIPDR